MAPRSRRAVDLIVDVAEESVQKKIQKWREDRHGHTADATSTSSLFLLSRLSNTDITMKFAASLLLTAV
eukprot:scaffold15400_cov303-Alexandrium_tamarense.AAC.2